MRAGFSVVLVAIASSAAAQPASPKSAGAEAQFAKGRELRKLGRWVEACVAFEDSERFDPQSGTLYNLAECDAHIGKLASAWAAFRTLAQQDTNAGRRARSRKLASALEPRLPKLAITVTPHVADLVVTMNGTEATALVGIESPVDLGTLELAARAPGYEPWSSTIDVHDEGKTTAVAIALHPSEHAPEPSTATSNPALPAPTPAPTATRSLPPLPAAPPSHRGTHGVAGVSLGGALVIGGLVAGELARDKWNDATAICPNQTCSPGNLATAQSLGSAASTRATIADVLFAAGVVSAGVGIYLFATPDRAESSTALRVIASPSAITLVGGF